MNSHATIDEYLDVVDESDNVIGKEKRSKVYKENLYCRVINAFVINKKRELWIPRRTAHKRTYPLCLDMSVGGHVESGETYEDAFKREAKEELNIDIEKVPYRFLAYLTPKQNNTHAFMKVYEIPMDEAPNYNKDDFVEYFWLTPEELFKRLESGDKSKSDLPKLIQIFYGADLESW